MITDLLHLHIHGVEIAILQPGDAFTSTDYIR